MWASLFKKLFGTSDDRLLLSLTPVKEAINRLEAKVKKLTDDQLRAKTTLLKTRVLSGEPLDNLLPDAFAFVREASARTLGQRHYDVQLLGGIILHNGMIAEMATGEGKTLVATLPAYLNALVGKGVHVVTVNDYLTQRDAEWMAVVYQFLGISVGHVTHDMSDGDRKKAYSRDVTYVTNHELGFDYLRDNMRFHIDDLVLRALHFSIVDEVDSILIDEARTPLVISGPSEQSSESYRVADSLVRKLGDGDYEKDERYRSVVLTDSGLQKVERMLRSTQLLKDGSLYDQHNICLMHYVNQALKAHKLFRRNVDYIVKGGKVVIIDEFTGRMMEGRRYSESIHQAIEAKESLEIQKENQTLASITYQNLFRLYSKLAGMTGTAKTDESEFLEIYRLKTVRIQPNKQIIRLDLNDEVYRTDQEKYESVVTLIKLCQPNEQPILVGTTSIEKSEILSSILKKHSIKHEVLNARYHEREAQIIAQAGVPSSVTIATNMAGRGTDIKLGGSQHQEVRNSRELLEEKVKKAGGLYVVGTERHESRRIDNQLRGRSGRQGDPGVSKFFLSLEDNLMRSLGADKVNMMLGKLGIKHGEVITHPWVSKAIERAQRRVEAQNFELRKHLLRFDDVMNDQRKIIYEQRREIMISDDVSEIIHGMFLDTLQVAQESLVSRKNHDYKLHSSWSEVENFQNVVMELFNIDLQPLLQNTSMSTAELELLVMDAWRKKINDLEERYGQQLLRLAQKSILLHILDRAWKDHLYSLDNLRQGINLRAYAQRDPLNEYKSEAFSLFQRMIEYIRETVVGAISSLKLSSEATENQQVYDPSPQAKASLRATYSRRGKRLVRK